MPSSINGSMMLSDRDPNDNGGGRASRASNMSAVSRATNKPPGPVGVADLLPAVAPGVQSMLRTSTEMGNVMGLTGDVYGMGGLPRGMQRRGASSRLSTASSVSNNSSHASRRHQQWPSSSSGPRRSAPRDFSAPQYVADTLSPTVMSVQGSSPLFSTQPRPRDSHRSQSMTNATQYPPLRLQPNRSVGSLRPEGHSSYRSPLPPHPRRFGRPAHRPASPAASDSASTYHGRFPPPNHNNLPHIPAALRTRVPSDNSLGQRSRMNGSYRPSSRGNDPVYYSSPSADVPPMPPIPQMYRQQMPVDQPNVLNRSITTSSHSTGRRTDSDAPSSDMATPPTPRDGSSMEVFSSSSSTRMAIGSSGLSKQVFSLSPQYYDYSEHFEDQQLKELNVRQSSMPVVNRVKAIEGLELAGPLVRSQLPPTKKSVDVVRSKVPGITELPASPVPRRITRKIVRQGLELSSTTGDTTSDLHTPAQPPISTICPDDESTTTNLTSDKASSLPLPLKNSAVNRHSILSQAGSSVIDSSTLNFAVRHSIPVLASSGPDPKTHSAPTSPSRSATNTEDGMSELLAGYQHSDSRHEKGLTPGKSSSTPLLYSKETCVEGRSDRKGKHVQKSSDGQSFKTCTDIPDAVSPELKKTRREKCPANTLERDSSVKELDAGSFKTCEDPMTPDRVVSVSPSRPPSGKPPVQELLVENSISELPSSSPRHAVVRKKGMPLREPSLPASTKVQSVSKPSLQQSATSVPVSSSSSTLSVLQPALAIPPRASSTSKEAQHVTAVTSFLMRFVKGRKQPKEEELSRPELEGSDASAYVSRRGSVSASSPSKLWNILKTPEKVLTKQRIIPEKRVEVPTVPEEIAPAKTTAPKVALQKPSAPPAARFTAPSPVIQEPSSVYSPQDSSVQARFPSSPPSIPTPPKFSRRESQTTTHLEWHRYQPVHARAASASEPHLTIAQSRDDTTTDLRLSMYRYGGQSYLPDLKEESHEDSSLNTSASNLKSSNFRFQNGGPPAVRQSIDDALMFSRSSMQSQRRSGLAFTVGLPSIEFSQINLAEKMNDALGLRISRSLDDLRPVVEATASVENTPPRPVSAGVQTAQEAREKYRSIFGGLSSKDPTGEAARPISRISIAAPRRTYSPEKLMAEVDMLTIPSLGGLTQRISELFPALKDDYPADSLEEHVEDEVHMEQTLEEIHEVGGPSQKRSSARLRPMPGSPHMVVVDDAVFEEITNKEKGRSSLESEEGAPWMQSESGGDGHGNTANTQTRLKTPLTTPAAPSPVHLRPRLRTVDQNDFRASVEPDFSSRRSLRSVSSTPTGTDTQPWNSEKNYPWTKTAIPSVDISLPPPVAVKSSPRLGPSHLRNRLSDATTLSSFSTHSPTTSPFGTASGPSSNRHSRRFSLFGCGIDQPHAAGERYPTSALSPPTAIFRDHPDLPTDDEDEDDFTTSRKRHRSLRQRFKNVASYAAELGSPGRARPSTTSTLQDSAGEALAFTSEPRRHRHTFRDAEGMSRVTYHRHSLVQKLKSLWHKGGSLLRSFSRREHPSAPPSPVTPHN